MYSNVNMYELPPHVFAVGDQAYRAMRDELADQVPWYPQTLGTG